MMLYLVRSFEYEGSEDGFKFVSEMLSRAEFHKYSFRLYTHTHTAYFTSTVKIFSVAVFDTIFIQHELYSRY